MKTPNSWYFVVFHWKCFCVVSFDNTLNSACLGSYCLFKKLLLGCSQWAYSIVSAWFFIYYSNARFTNTCVDKFVHTSLFMSYMYSKLACMIQNISL